MTQDRSRIDAGGARVDGMGGVGFMGETLAMSGSQKYGCRLTLENGGLHRKPQPAYRVRTREEVELDERMRRKFSRCVGRNGTVPSRAVQEIREGRQAPWRKNARRVIEMVEAGVPSEDILAAAVGEFAEWVHDVLDARAA